MITDSHILVFNLDDYHRKQICFILEKAGFTHVTEVINGANAIEILSEQSVDLVITDVDLGELDGWRLTRLIRSGALRVKADIPIIIVSSTYSERIAEVTSKECQVNSFIPFSKFESLPKAIENILTDDHAGPPKSTLLVIEDYADTVKLIQRILSNRFDIEVATDGESGLSAWEARRHDLVLLDVMLPEKSGKDVLKDILALSPNQSVVMMTAYATPERAGSLILDGAVDFVSKPFRADQLRQVCEIAVHREDFIISNQEFSQRQDALHQEKERAEITLQSIADGVITTDIDGRVDYMNPVAERLSGWSIEKAKGKLTSEVLSPLTEEDAPVAPHPVEHCITQGEIVKGLRGAIYRNHEGLILRLDCIVSPIRNRPGKVVGAVKVFRDVTEPYMLEQKLEYQASHDSLTGLTNRAAFEERLKAVLEEEQHKEVAYSLCYIDLDQFKVINDTCGHIAGDQLLRSIAGIMLHKIRKHSDTLARFGGDEFILLLEDCDIDQASRIAGDICEAIQEYRFIYEGKTFSIGASIGVAPITAEARDLNNALARADSACYMAKEKGRNRVHVYRSNDEELMHRYGEMHVISQINQACEEDQFALYYQEIKPLNDIDEGLHIEVLLRMQDGKGGWVAPGFFLPAAERYNIAAKIDRWVVKHVLEWISSHCEDELDKLSMCSVNLSGLSLCDDQFIQYVEEMIAEYKIPTNKLCFEITETAAISNLNQANIFVTAMRRHGCLFALDDFGSGMSSYAYLKHLEVDFLKVDGLFVRDVLHDPIDRAMVKSINEVGHIFGLKTIAEYVENEEILEEMREIGLDFIQGYVNGKPASLDELKLSELPLPAA
ncbi:diguanylate cyclase/phosphodiesterase (GGDEF & EAL domains) with PAS/PAC sensor(s) [hydrothermal vent metagenome]|uniref:Diguanylate cyclase/phosphodiesterase (GGDEF & EAL domains) with PAS/PAC sensor(S) n=1 Tax=hydrothermal vent metagenome TaxID=652676 RepID=A0A3B0Z7G7_9ZZZZ